MLRPDFIAFHRRTIGFAVRCVKIVALPPGDQRKGTVGIRAQFIRVARTPDIVAGRHNPTTGNRVGTHQTHHKLALPTLK